MVRRSCFLVGALCYLYECVEVASYFLFLFHLVHTVAAEPLVVHGDGALVNHDVRLEAR